MSICAAPDTVLMAQDYIEHHMLDMKRDNFVKVSHINSPSDFYVQPKELLPLIDKFTRNMTEFYDKLHDTNELVIPFDKLCVYHFGVTYYNEKIHRIRIENINKQEKNPVACVYHIDYGFFTHETPSDLYYMMKMFSFIEQQAVPCKCAYIKPNIMPWQNAAKKRFTDLVRNKDLTAEVIAFDEDGYKFEVILTDNILQFNEINVNATLVNEGYASVL